MPVAINEDTAASWEIWAAKADPSFLEQAITESVEANVVPGSDPSQWTSPTGPQHSVMLADVQRRWRRIVDDAECPFPFGNNFVAGLFYLAAEAANSN